MIPLWGRDGQIRAWAIVDDEDAEAVNRYRWNLASTGRPVRHVAKADRKEAESASQYMSNFIMGPQEDGKWVQYVSKDRLDHRRKNLRVRLRYKDVWGEVNGWRKYGMDRARYTEMLDQQGGVCAICKKPPEEKIQSRGTGKVPAGQRKLHVDHCHRTGKVRALLCWSCNVGLGKFGDDSQMLRAAANYLDEHNPFV